MQGQVKVVPARWWHVPALSRLIRDTRRRPGGEAAVLWFPQWSPTLGLIQSAWTAPVPGMAGPRSFVAESGGRAVGLAQMRPLEEPRQWEVVFLAVELPQAVGRGAASAEGGPAPLLFVPDRRAAHLLGELCDSGVELGAERIVARVEEGGGRYELFKQVGFSPVVREYDYFLPADEATGRRDAGQGGRRTAPPAAGRLVRAAPAVPGQHPQAGADGGGQTQPELGPPRGGVGGAPGPGPRRAALGGGAGRPKGGLAALAAPGPGPAGAAPGGAAGRSSDLRAGPGLCWRWPWRRVAPRPGACWCGPGSTSRGSWRLSRRADLRLWGAAC